MLEESKPLYSFDIGSFPVEIKTELVVQWVVMLIIITLAYWATKGMKKHPNKKQTVVELLYNAIKNIVIENMGEKYGSFVPFIGTLAVFILILNLTGLVGVAPPTENFSVTIGLALIVFVVIQANAIKKVGLGHYFLGYGKPLLPMLPLNIMERLMLPVSLSLRLFGNVMAATVLIELAYEALHSISFFAQLGLPIPLHAYFDIFDGVIQMVIFVMLTMLNIRTVAEH